MKSKRELPDYIQQIEDLQLKLPLANGRIDLSQKALAQLASLLRDCIKLSKLIKHAVPPDHHMQQLILISCNHVYSTTNYAQTTLQAIGPITTPSSLNEARLQIERPLADLRDSLSALKEILPKELTNKNDAEDEVLMQVSKFSATGERFLDKEDRNWLVNKIGSSSRFQTVEGRRNLLVDGLIPDFWVGDIDLNGASYEIARTVINDLELRGNLPMHPQKHALCSLLEAMLDSMGYGDAVQTVAILIKYELNSNQNELSKLSEQYGVPLPLFDGESYSKSPDLNIVLPADLDNDYIDGKLEALYASTHGNWLDIDFFIKGARASRSVCRLEWQKRGEGTGFLITNDLILTSYHVINPMGFYGDLTKRLQQCEIRFGAYRHPNGETSAGTRVVRLNQHGLISYSPFNDLDYALLQLLEPVSDRERIQPAMLSHEYVYEDQIANIIQHPFGGAMKVTLRHNQVIKILPKRVYYLSDTEDGSSGSPVFNDDWRVIALHRAAGLKDKHGNLILEANVGVPVTEIFNEIKDYL